MDDYYFRKQEERKASQGNKLTYYGKPCRTCGNTERYVSNNRCVPCKKKNSKKYRDSHLDEERQRSRNWYKRNIDKVLEYKIKNKERLKEYRKLRYVKDRDRFLEYSAKWYRRNIEHVKLYNESYRKNNQSVVRASSKRWRDNNPDYGKEWKRDNKIKLIIYDNNRRSKILKSGGVITDQEWLSLLEKYNNSCTNCSSKENIQADHIIPISKGGANYIWNIQPLCKVCNLTKATKIIDYRPKENIPQEYIDFLATLE